MSATVIPEFFYILTTAFLFFFTFFLTFFPPRSFTLLISCRHATCASQPCPEDCHKDELWWGKGTFGRSPFIFIFLFFLFVCLFDFYRCHVLCQCSLRFPVVGGTDLLQHLDVTGDICSLFATFYYVPFFPLHKCTYIQTHCITRRIGWQ